MTMMVAIFSLDAWVRRLAAVPIFRKFVYMTLIMVVVYRLPDHVVNCRICALGRTRQGSPVSIRYFTRGIAITGYMAVAPALPTTRAAIYACALPHYEAEGKAPEAARLQLSGPKPSIDQSDSQSAHRAEPPGRHRREDHHRRLETPVGLPDAHRTGTIASFGTGYGAEDLVLGCHLIEISDLNR